MVVSLVVFFALAAHAAPAKASDPLAVEIARMKTRGFHLGRRLDEDVGGRRLSAAVFEADDGRSTQLNVYAVLRGRALPVYIHPASGERQVFGEEMDNGRFPDLFGDGGAALAYRSDDPALKTSILYILRYQAPYFVRAGAFADGRLLAIKPPRVGYFSRPLGRFYTVGCSGFQTMSQTARAPRVSRWDGKVFVPSRDTAWIESLLREDEKALSAARKDKWERPGDYLGIALDVYFDLVALNREKEGWSRVDAELKAPAGAPAGSASCLEKIRSQLRQALVMSKFH